jgi:hypothetical protein
MGGAEFLLHFKFGKASYGLSRWSYSQREYRGICRKTDVALLLHAMRCDDRCDADADAHSTRS